MDRFEQIRVFVNVVEAGGFTRATERTGISRAALSKHVLQLEDRLGARLLDRTTRRVAVTEAGRAYYEKCRHILDELRDAEAGVGATNRGPTGELRIVAPTNFGLSYVGPAITEFLVAYPDLRIQLALNDRPIDPIEGGVDIAIRVGRGDPPASASLVAQKITTSRRILCASPDYLARRGRPTRPDDLRDHDCLCYSYVEDPLLWRLADADGEHLVPVSGRVVTSAGPVLRATAARGLGIAYGPRVFFEDELKSGGVTPVLPAYSLPEAVIYALYPVSRHPQAKVTAFTKFMQTFFKGRFT